MTMTLDFPLPPVRSPVFVVEADRDLRGDVRDLLWRTHGYAVLEAGHPSEALALLRALPTSVVLIVDTMLSGTARRELRSSRPLPLLQCWRRSTPTST